MEFRVLGPVEVEVGGEVVAIPALRQRELLALLLIHVGEYLSTDRILDELWGEDQPSSGASALRFHVSKLRAALGADPSPIVTRGSGYVLGVDPGSVDAVRFEQLLAEALGEMSDDPDRAASLIGEGLSLWRGDPYSDLGDPEFADGEVRRLNELRAQAIEVGFAAELALGRHAEIVGELEATLTESPFRERLWAHLMVALYRSGRQVDALQAFRRASETLKSLGIEPSEELRDLENRILIQDQNLLFKPPRPTNLPSPASSFIGRGEETTAVAGRCRTSRLVTVTGIGGIGKTRLAIEVARGCLDAFADGAFLLDLANVSSPEEVGRRFLSVLGVAEQPRRPAIETLIEALGGAQQLLVVDNCEHVVEGVVETLSRLIPACPMVHVLATSRVRLGVDGEETWELGGLSVDGEGASDAARLFADRAHLASQTFAVSGDDAPVVGEICRALDGSPLAIELAAARIRIMTIGEIAERLSDRFAFLVDARRTAPERHKTLVSMIEWSYGLLSESDQRLFRCIGVFQGGFDRDALVAMSQLSEITVVEALEQLVDASLVSANTSGTTTRYRLLETVRAYAIEQLQHHGDADGARDRHLATFAALGREAFKHQMGSFRLGQPTRDEVLHWRSTIGLDIANLRSALDRALEIGDLDAAHEIAAPLVRYWSREAQPSQARAAATAVLAAGDYPSTPQHCALLAANAWRLMDAGDVDRAEDALDEVAEASRHLGPDYENAAAAVVALGRANIAESRGDILELIAHEEAAARHATVDGVPWAGAAYWNVGFYSMMVGDIQRATEVADMLGADSQNPPYRSLSIRARVAAYRGDHATAMELTREALMHPTERYVAAIFRQFVGNAHLNLGQLDDARWIGESLEALYRDGDLTMRWLVERAKLLMGYVALRTGDGMEAAARFGGVVTEAREVGDRYFLWAGLIAAADRFAAMGDKETAAVALGHCAVLTDRYRYAPAGLDCIQLITLETLAAELDPDRLDELVAEGASTSTEVLADRVLTKLAERASDHRRG